jgi:hypothetical protein
MVLRLLGIPEPRLLRQAYSGLGGGNPRFGAATLQVVRQAARRQKHSGCVPR